MNYNSVLCEALKESLIEKERAASAVTGIVKKIAEKKEALLIEAIKRERPYLSEGFSYARSRVSQFWNNSFTLEACFLKKDVIIPFDATKKERELLVKYKRLTKNADFDYAYKLVSYVEDAKRICSELSQFEPDDLLDANFLTRGFNF